MSIIPLSVCPITELIAENSNITNDFYEYNINYNSFLYTIRLSIDIIDNNQISLKVIDSDKLWILKGMLHNNEWPIESETIITSGLILQLIRFGEYPKDFDAKIDYFILKCYLNGGLEYKVFEKDPSKILYLYSKDKDEYDRLFNALFKKKLIDYANSSDMVRRFTLSEKGMEHAIELRKISDANTNIDFASVINRPSIIFVSTKEDEYYVKKMAELLKKTRAKVVYTNPIDLEDRNISISTYKQEFHSDKLNYIIFIKSYNSDVNNNYGSILEVALEAHDNTDKKNYDFIFFGFVDDSDIQSRPRLVDYNTSSMDIRIKTNRTKILVAIKNDYNRQQILQDQNIKHDFKKVTVTDFEKRWLEAVYRKFLDNEKFQYRELLTTFWDKTPSDFDPQEMNPLLIRNGTEIGLLGIWIIDQNSKIFSDFDSIVYFIRDVMKNRNNISSISSHEIISEFPNISPKEVYQIFKILHQLGKFSSGISSNEDLSESRITVDNDNIFQHYRDYNGVERLIENEYQIYNNRFGKVIGSDKEILDGKLLGEGIDVFKTRYTLRNVNDISPVMGVTELANDLAEIIHSLPSEKGQMVGVFGKWGRGKSFLLKELWLKLQNKSNSYIKLEFHAWKYQETPASWAYLYEIFSKEYLGKKGPSYYYKLFKLNKKRYGIWPIVEFIFIIAFFCCFSFIIPNVLNNYPRVNTWYIQMAAYSFLGISFVSLISNIYKKYKVKAIDLIKKYTYKNSFKENLGLQADIQDELIMLLKVWMPERKVNFFSKIYKRKEVPKIILLVEDIDRCSEDRIIQNIDALRILLEDSDIAKRVVIITAIDETILKNAIKIKYSSIISNLNSRKMKAIVSEYLDKLFISAIKLGELTVDQKKQYFLELIKQEVEEKTISDLSEIDINEYLKEVILDASPPINFENELISQQNDNLSKQLGKINGELIEDLLQSDVDTKENQDEIISEDSKETGKELNDFEKLTAKEVYIMQSIISRWKGATPRRIRIFYYRYLLSKNLLMDKYVLSKNRNIWQDEKGIRVLMWLIVDYSKSYSSDSISKTKNELSHSENEETDIKINDKMVKVDCLHYLKLLEVLELVIAY